MPRGSNGFGYDPYFYVPAFGRTAAFRRAQGDDIGDTRLVAGVRVWF